MFLNAVNISIIVTGLVGFVNTFAIFRAPITALNLQKDSEKSDEKKHRKLSIFKSLMATRANTVSHEHVQALNMIDIEFYEEKNIRNSWNIYRDHLNLTVTQNEASQKSWEDKRVDYLTDLLYEMSQFFGYDFDKVIIKRGSYIPIAHGIISTEQAIIRKELVEVLARGKPIKIELNKNKTAVHEKIEV